MSPARLPSAGAQVLALLVHHTRNDKGGDPPVPSPTAGPTSQRRGSPSTPGHADDPLHEYDETHDQLINKMKNDRCRRLSDSRLLRNRNDKLPKPQHDKPLKSTDAVHPRPLSRPPIPNNGGPTAGTLCTAVLPTDHPTALTLRRLTLPLRRALP